MGFGACRETDESREEVGKSQRGRKRHFLGCRKVQKASELAGTKPESK